MTKIPNIDTGPPTKFVTGKMAEYAAASNTCLGVNKAHPFICDLTSDLTGAHEACARGALKHLGVRVE